MVTLLEIIETIFLVGFGANLLIGFVPAFVRINNLDEGLWFLVWMLASIVSLGLGILFSVINDRIYEKNRQK